MLGAERSLEHYPGGCADGPTDALFMLCIVVLLYLIVKFDQWIRPGTYTDTDTDAQE